MAFETSCTVGYPAYLSLSDHLVSCSEEQCTLMNFCCRLASKCNVADESPYDVNETRQQAKLLMNLMNCSNSDTRSINLQRNSPLERSISDQSFTSCHSALSTKKHDRFSFTCPSLSLDNSTSSLHDVEREVSSMQLSLQTDRLPAHLLLGRSLKVDDPDAIRLSADAMARNVLQSFQQAMHWRIQAWVVVLSKKLVQYEYQMLASGATLEGLKILLQTPEARLIIALQNLVQDRGLAANSAITSFEVLSPRIEDFEEEARRPSRITSDATPTTSSSSASSSSLDEFTSLSDHSSDVSMGSCTSETYSYVVAHQLRFHCRLHLQTLVGFTEIDITVPGTIAGSFAGSEIDPTAELKSVKLDLDTNVLASLIDKACRAVVRSSVEKVIAQPLESKSFQESSGHNKTEEINAVHDETETAVTHEAPSFTLTSPPSTTNMDRASSCAFVTPGPDHADDLYHDATPSNVLIPIPDDLKSTKRSEQDFPRRISPQPTTTSHSRDYGRSGSTNSDDSSTFVNFPIVSTRAPSLKRRTPPPLSRADDFDLSTSNRSRNTAASHDQNTGSTIQTNSDVEFLQLCRSLPLISPPISRNDATKYFHHGTENGPSLPLLVEAACQIATTGSCNVNIDSESKV